MNYPGDYTLCVCFEEKVEHYRIIYKQNKLTIDEESYFENLTDLVEVHQSSHPFNNYRIVFCFLAKSSIVEYRNTLLKPMSPIS